LLGGTEVAVEVGVAVEGGTDVPVAVGVAVEVGVDGGSVVVAVGVGLVTPIKPCP
jgi:hypothetical protein